MRLNVSVLQTGQSSLSSFTLKWLIQLNIQIFLAVFKEFFDRIKTLKTKFDELALIGERVTLK